MQGYAAASSVMQLCSRIP